MNIYSRIFDLTNLLSLKTGFASALIGGGAAVFEYFYGGENSFVFMLLLVLVIAFDWSGGIAASKKDGSYSSAYGIQGVMRTVVILALPAFGHLFDVAFKTPLNMVFFMIWGGILYHTLQSMTANFIRAGWDKWVPTWAFEWVANEIEAKINRSQFRLPTSGAKVEEIPNRENKELPK
jgi:phage-related holin